MNTLKKLIELVKNTEHPVLWFLRARSYAFGLTFTQMIDREYSAMIWCKEELKMREYLKETGFPVVNENQKVV